MMGELNSLKPGPTTKTANAAGPHKSIHVQELEAKIQKSIGKRKSMLAGSVIVEQLQTESSDEEFEL